MAVDHGVITWPGASGSVVGSNVDIHDSNGANISIGQKTMANSLPVVIASDQSPLPITQGVNTNGSFAQITNLTTSAQTFTPPSNTVGFVLESDSSNSNNIRWRIGAAATTSAGMLMEPGRDTGYVPCAAAISVIATGGTNQVIGVQWVLSS